MTVLTKPQIITQGNKPAFAVIPWDEYELLIQNQAEPDESGVWFPNEVVKANVRGDSLIKAWREHKNMTQADLAKKAGIRQSALARMEKPEASPRKTTLKKLAIAMDISPDQLVE